MKLGINTDSLGHLSLTEAAAVCADFGLEQVELGCGNWSPAPHIDLDSLTTNAGKRPLTVFPSLPSTAPVIPCSPAKRVKKTGAWQKRPSCWQSSWVLRPW